MTAEYVELTRTWLYPFGLIASLAFTLRFIVQWWQSEQAGRSIVPKSFWILSCLGNTMVAVHSFIQLHYPMYILQSLQIALSWRNLNLMGPSPWSRRQTVRLLILSGIGATVLFAAQEFFLPPTTFAWIRSPRVYASPPEVGFWVHFMGCLGIAAFSLRFWLQWWEAESKKKSILPRRFWWVSIIGTLMAGAYFFLLSDWVNLVGPLCALVPYSRNLILLNREQTEKCDIAIIAGEVSGDLLGGVAALALRADNPNLGLCGVAGPSMRQQGVKPWFRTESFHVMGIVDVVKRAPFLWYALRTIVRHILTTRPSAVLFIDQPSLSIAVAKRLRKLGYTGKIVQIVAPTVWAYRRKRADTVAAYFDLILPLYKFEVEYFQDKLPTTWIGHPASSLANHRQTTDDTKKVIALFPGSRPGEVRRNLQLQLHAAAILLKEYPELTVAISATEGTKELVSRTAKELFHGSYEIVEFADRYALMHRSKAAIAKSGTITLELALLNVPTVCCYQTGRFTRWWARHILDIRTPFFALPNILTGQETIPECILPPVTPETVANALRPYVTQEKRLPHDIGQKLLSQIDPGADAGTLIATAVSTMLRDNS